MKGRQVRLVFWFRDSVVRLVSLSKMPTGRLLRLLLVSVSVVRLVSSLNTTAGRLLTPVVLRVSDVKPVRPPKSPAFSVVRVALLEMARVVIPAKSVVVMSAQSDLPVTAATIASRTSVVRVQTPVNGTVTATLPTLTLP